MSITTLIILIDIYATGALVTWWRTLRVMPAAARPAEDVGDILIVLFWPVMWAIALLRLVLLFVFTKEEA